MSEQTGDVFSLLRREALPLEVDVLQRPLGVGLPVADEPTPEGDDPLARACRELGETEGDREEAPRCEGLHH